MLIDTSGFFAMHSANDQYHKLAIELYATSRLRLTTSYVLAEYVALALIRGLPRDKVIAFSEEILNDANIEIVWVDSDLHAQAIKLIERKAGQRLFAVRCGQFCCHARTRFGTSSHH